MFTRLLQHPIHFRYAFYALMLFSIVINGFVFENENNFYILYIFSSLFLGIGFYSMANWAITILTVLLVLCRFFLIPEPSHSFITFITYLMTYLLMTFISVGLMRNAQKIKEEQLSLTTALSKALDSRDAYTSFHSVNTSKYAVEIAQKMKLHEDMIDSIRIGALLHDIGKIGIPEDILTKPGKLTKEEFNIIKNHPEVGHEMIKHVTSLKEKGILDIVLYHHERFDGKGYPLGLKGNEIPLPARIVALADAFDAMTSTRVYRDPLPIDYVLNEIFCNKGTQFDPEVADIFLSQFPDFSGSFQEKVS
ncbi:HD-GYP domain-containing protein [Bacillus sp. T3]|uniref:HD-GYP domain-containing protein n=1 Tax=Bacillus sp. T3 TaxID=467262 RepID=UPI0029816632|nr:HD-GYP domain-containing protein [Bacillus sp. T3]